MASTSTTVVCPTDTHRKTVKALKTLKTTSSKVKVTTTGNSHTHAKASERPLSSYQVFAQFVRPNPNGGNTGEKILSKECFDLWLSSRTGAVMYPEDSFRRTLTAHLRGRDRRKPFAPDVEMSILKILREEENGWTRVFGSAHATSTANDLLDLDPTSMGNDAATKSDHTCKIGSRGFNKLGYHEELALNASSSSPAAVGVKNGKNKSKGIKISKGLVKQATKKAKMLKNGKIKKEIGVDLGNVLEGDDYYNEEEEKEIIQADIFNDFDQDDEPSGFSSGGILDTIVTAKRPLVCNDELKNIGFEKPVTNKKAKLSIRNGAESIFQYHNKKSAVSRVNRTKEGSTECGAENAQDCECASHSDSEDSHTHSHSYKSRNSSSHLSVVHESYPTRHEFDASMSSALVPTSHANSLFPGRPFIAGATGFNPNLSNFDFIGGNASFGGITNELTFNLEEWKRAGLVGYYTPEQLAQLNNSAMQHGVECSLFSPVVQYFLHNIHNNHQMTNTANPSHIPNLLRSNNYDRNNISNRYCNAPSRLRSEQDVANFKEDLSTAHQNLDKYGVMGRAECTTALTRANVSDHPRFSLEYRVPALHERVFDDSKPIGKMLVNSKLWVHVDNDQRVKDMLGWDTRNVHSINMIGSTLEALHCAKYVYPVLKEFGEAWVRCTYCDAEGSPRIYMMQVKQYDESHIIATLQDQTERFKYILDVPLFV